MAERPNSLSVGLVGETCTACDSTIIAAMVIREGSVQRVQWTCRATHSIVFSPDSTFDQVLGALADHCAKAHRGRCALPRAA